MQAANDRQAGPAVRATIGIHRSYSSSKAEPSTEIITFFAAPPGAVLPAGWSAALPAPVCKLKRVLFQCYAADDISADGAAFRRDEAQRRAV
jgi:hypothetical protein